MEIIELKTLRTINKTREDAAVRTDFIRYAFIIKYMNIRDPRFPSP